MPAHAPGCGALRELIPPVRVVYYDPLRHDASDGRAGGAEPVFRSGEAGSVALGADGDFTSDARVHIPPNSLHALHEHGVVAALGRLDFAIGPLVPGRDAVLRPTALSDASRILYEADRRTYGRVWEFTVARRASEGAEPTEYRIVIDNREYQRTLSRLQYLAVTSSREGRALRLRL